MSVNRPLILENMQRDIFKTVSQIDFKLEICCYNVYGKDTIDFWPSA